MPNKLDLFKAGLTQGVRSRKFGSGNRLIIRVPYTCLAKSLFDASISLKEDTLHTLKYKLTKRLTPFFWKDGSDEQSVFHLIFIESNENEDGIIVTISDVDHLNKTDSELLYSFCRQTFSEIGLYVD